MKVYHLIRLVVIGVFCRVACSVELNHPSTPECTVAVSDNKPGYTNRIVKCSINFVSTVSASYAPPVVSGVVEKIGRTALHVCDGELSAFGAAGELCSSAFQYLIPPTSITSSDIDNLQSSMNNTNGSTSELTATYSSHKTAPPDLPCIHNIAVTHAPRSSSVPKGYQTAHYNRLSSPKSPATVQISKTSVSGIHQQPTDFTSTKKHLRRTNLDKCITNRATVSNVTPVPINHLPIDNNSNISNNSDTIYVNIPVPTNQIQIDNNSNISNNSDTNYVNIPVPKNQIQIDNNSNISNITTEYEKRFAMKRLVNNFNIEHLVSTAENKSNNTHVTDNVSDIDSPMIISFHNISNADRLKSFLCVNKSVISDRTALTIKSSAAIVGILSVFHLMTSKRAVAQPSNSPTRINMLVGVGGIAAALALLTRPSSSTPDPIVKVNLRDSDEKTAPFFDIKIIIGAVIGGFVLLICVIYLRQYIGKRIDARDYEQDQIDRIEKLIQH